MKPCTDCPFKVSSSLEGSPEWLKDIVKIRKLGGEEYGSHSCHQTDPNADGYKGSKKKRECMGYLTMIMNKYDETPGKGGVYDSLDSLIERYLRHWLGDKEFENLKAAARL